MPPLVAAPWWPPLVAGYRVLAMGRLWWPRLGGRAWVPPLVAAAGCCPWWPLLVAAPGAENQHLVLGVAAPSRLTTFSEYGSGNPYHPHIRGR